MGGRHPAGLRRRDESGHKVVNDAIKGGYVGAGQPYIVPGFASQEAAERGRQAINNAARHLGVSCSARRGEDVHPAAGGTFELHFRLFPKSEGRKHITAAAGGDPANLAYNPFRRGDGPAVDESGAPIAQLRAVTGRLRTVRFRQIRPVGGKRALKPGPAQLGRNFRSGRHANPPLPLQTGSAAPGRRDGGQQRDHFPHGQDERPVPSRPHVIAFSSRSIRPVATSRGVQTEKSSPSSCSR